MRDPEPSVPELSWPEVLAWRAARQGLGTRAPASDALAVVGQICGLHAQLMSSAELSVWARVGGVDSGWVARALWEDRTLVKAWAMRGTLHLLPVRELPLWLGAMGTYAHYRRPSWYRAAGLTASELDAVCEAVSTALDGPVPLTREALADAVAAGTGLPGIGEKLRHGFGVYLKPASFQGRLCFAPNEGRNVRFTRPDRWVGADGVPAADGPAALRAVAARWLAAYAPATREDLGRWWGMSPAAAGRVLAGVECERVSVEGAEALMPPGGAAAVAGVAGLPARGVVRLLPAFDPLVVGATRSGVVTPVERREAVYRPQAWLSPVVAVDGSMAGTWRHERRGSALDVTVSLWRSVDRAAVEAEAESLAGWLGGRLRLAWG